MHQNHSRSERIADGCIHAVGLTASFIGVALLMSGGAHRTLVANVSLGVYAAGLIAMLGFSAAYNLISITGWKAALQRCDHAAIFLMIAATYTPFAYAKMGGTSGMSLLIIVWSVALIGAGAKLTLGTARWERLSLFLYIGLGWAGLLFIRPLIEAVSSDALLLLVLGGLAYTTGVIFHVWEKLPYQNSIWHLFVLAGTCFHFLAVVDVTQS